MLEGQNNDFHKCVKSFTNSENPDKWQPSDLFPSLSELEAANEHADYFNGISCEYRAITRDDIPLSYDQELPLLAPKDIEEEITKGKKPKSRVPGDLFVNVLTDNLSVLSSPICRIFNAIQMENKWPQPWLVEYVSVIPKNNIPESPADCRNLSCTNFLSKVFERIVLRWAQAQVLPGRNQYGGQKGCGTAHFLADIWDQITDHLEDQRAAAIVTAIDYSKAFNRLEHGSVLKAFRDAGASNQVLSLLASFLIGRQMTVRVGNHWSNKRTVNAGAPQGSVLGTYIFNVGTDTLEDGYEDEEISDDESDNGLDLLFMETQSEQTQSVSTPIRPATRPPALSSPYQCSPLPHRPSQSNQLVELLPRVVNPPTTAGTRIEPSW